MARRKTNAKPPARKTRARKRSPLQPPTRTSKAMTIVDEKKTTKPTNRVEEFENVAAKIAGSGANPRRLCREAEDHKDGSMSVRTDGGYRIVKLANGRIVRRGALPLRLKEAEWRDGRWMFMHKDRDAAKSGWKPIEEHGKWYPTRSR